MAFVHLHNHSDFSILDGATRVSAMVQRVVDLGMPALALTDHGYMFGIPDFDLACRAVNERASDLIQWQADCKAYAQGQIPSEPERSEQPSDDELRAYAQWETDRALWERTHDIQAIKDNKPPRRIKPIFGCEGYFVPDEFIEKKPHQRRFHLIFLAKNEQGYHNLIKMLSEAASPEMFYHYPRITLDMLRQYHEGIICTSACVSGIIPRMIIEGRDDEARSWALQFQEIFGDDFYLEVQDHGLADPSWNGFSDRMLAERIVALGKELGIKVVATNDNHYLLREDAQVQDALSCIKTASKIDDMNRIRMTGEEFYIKSEEEMRALFDWAPEVIDTTVEIANKCDYELDWSQIYLPKFPGLEEGETSEERFRKECEKGLARRFGDNWREMSIAGISIRERFEYEYEIICMKGFADYFLIVQEYVQWAKSHGIGVGPGRGSAAGALVAYAMNITNFDPLENGLMFERFLSPQRSEMPDIDMDFDDERRLEVVAHVRELYGNDRVCHVITYSVIKAKQAIKDATRILGLPLWLGEKLSKAIPDGQVELKYVLTKSENPKFADQFSADFAEQYNNDGDARRVIDLALSIERLHRGESVHPCAVLITPTPVRDHVPTKLDTKGGVEITQYDGHAVADMGLLKMDFLGLRTLTVIAHAKAAIKARYGIEIDEDAIPFDDPAIYKLLCNGHTAGVFQVESAGMTSTIKGMRPTEYKQILALLALYRPGPLATGMVSDYIDRMNGRKEVVYYDERLAPILEETYGTIVYQEQVMQISMKMSGFSVGESDKVRKAVAKKQQKLMTEVVQKWDDGNSETMYDHWMNGALRNGYTREVAQRIWEDVLRFAEYAFNKSHSAGYAILVMQTAWMKAHYPKEYMASVLSSYMGKTDQIVHYVSAYRHEGIEIFPPDINESGKDFTATDRGVLFGFAGIRGVGEGVGEEIMRERELRGPFKHLHDFVERMDTKQVNRRVIEALITAGAFDYTGYTRKQMMSFVDKYDPENIIDAAVRDQKVKSTGQMSMFDCFGDIEGSGFEKHIPEPDGKEWDRSFMLACEREVLGLYVSDHPLRPYEYALAHNRDFSFGELNLTEKDPNNPGDQEVYRVPEGKVLTFAGMLSSAQKKTTKKGDFMAVVTLEDLEGEVTAVVFPKLFKKTEKILFPQESPDTPASSREIFVKITGKLERSDRGDQIICSTIESLSLEEMANQPSVVELSVPQEKCTAPHINQLQEVMARYPGLDHIEMRLEASGGEVIYFQLPVKIDARNTGCIAEFIDILGTGGSVRVIQMD